MTQRYDWQCDGVPKDGKEYEGIGGKHELINNFGNECSVCGLPRDAMLVASHENQKTRIIRRDDPNPRTVNWKYLWIFFAGFAVVGGSLIAINPCWVEKFFVKCATDQENRNYKSQYDGINKQAEDVLSKFLQTNDLKVMQLSRDDLNSIVGQLEGMKNIKNAKCCPSLVISPLLEKDLPSLKANLTDVDVLIKAEKLAVEAGNLALKAQTVTELESSKSGFEDAIRNITIISDKSVLIQKVNTKKEEYKNKLAALEEKIKQEKEVQKQVDEAKVRTEQATQKQLDELKIRAEQAAQKQLDEAKNLGDRAIDKARLATTTDELKDVERMLIEAIDKLNQVTRNAVNDNEVSSKLKDYGSALSKVKDAVTKTSCGTALFGDCVTLPLTLP